MLKLRYFLSVMPSLLMPKQRLSVWEPQTTRLAGSLALVSNILVLFSNLFVVFSSFQVLLMVSVAGGAHLADFTPQGGSSFLLTGGSSLSIDHLLFNHLLLLLLVIVLQVNMSPQQLIASTPVCVFVFTFL